MNVYFAVAGALLILLALVHSFLGERALLQRLFRRTGLPKLFGDEFYTRRILRFTWHLTSIVWIGAGTAFLLIAVRKPDRTANAVADIFAVVFLLSGMFSVVEVHGRHPSWAVFLLVALLLWIGAR
ncbi:MAG TPA: hypothetical protein VEJ00_00280 [Candidatus Acidoferrales bacterium]|nr:hypothetical protein [Candidatus Acidoferrales bacterium]HXY51343.1 hypothetical protein [Terriglobales bacterium]